MRYQICGYSHSKCCSQHQAFFGSRNSCLNEVRCIMIKRADSLLDKTGTLITMAEVLIVGSVVITVGFTYGPHPSRYRRSFHLTTFWRELQVNFQIEVFWKELIGCQHAVQRKMNILLDSDQRWLCFGGAMFEITQLGSVAVYRIRFSLWC